MSWAHTILVDVDNVIHQIESEILSRFTHDAVKARNSNVPAPEVLATAKTAAAVIAKTLAPPAGSALSVTLSGHSAVPGKLSNGDSVSATVQIVTKPAAVEPAATPAAPAAEAVTEA